LFTPKSTIIIILCLTPDTSILKWEHFRWTAGRWNARIQTNLYCLL